MRSLQNKQMNKDGNYVEHGCESEKSIELEK